MAQDQIPEEELPPRLRFERLVKGPEPEVFRSVRPDPFEPTHEDEDAAPDPDATGTPAESDAEILRRFAELKEKLSEPGKAKEGVAPVPPVPDDEPAVPDELSSGSDSTEDEATLDQLQARIRQARREEREVGAVPAHDAPVEDEAERLTYDELAELKDAEARQRQKEAKKEKRRQRRKNRSFWQELPILIVVALVVAVIIKTFFFQAFYIPSGSMIPTLEINDRVLVNKLSYQFGAIERGDILVFDSPEAVEVDQSFIERVFRSVGEATGLTSPETVLIKRAIGLPGETVEIRDNQVYVNDSPIAEPYLADGATMRDMEPFPVPADHVFMMGDNRNQSRDSRVFGAIPKEDIVGRAFVTVWPPGAWGGL